MFCIVQLYSVLLMNSTRGSLLLFWCALDSVLQNWRQCCTCLHHQFICCLLLCYVPVLPVAGTSVVYPSVPEDLDFTTRTSAPRTTVKSTIAPPSVAPASKSTSTTTKAPITKHHGHHHTSTTRRPPESPKYEKPAGGAAAVFDGLGSSCIRVVVASSVAVVSALLLRWPMWFIDGTCKKEINRLSIARMSGVSTAK